MLRDDPSVLEQYGLRDILDVGVEEDAAFLTEMFMIHQTMDQVNMDACVNWLIRF